MLAIAAASGSFKCAFVHGVLSAFEGAGLRADAYGGTSASVLPAAAAATGSARELGVEYWLRGLEIAGEPDKGMSEVILAGIERFAPALRQRLFAPAAPRFVIPTSAVVSTEAAELTQGERASRLGRQLLLDTARGERGWIEEHLAPSLFDTHATEGDLELTPENFDAVVYASTRMLHAWRIPAWVSGEPHVDGSYTCSCPAMELADAGYDEVIAIGTEPGVINRDLFTDRPIPGSWKGGIIRQITPEADLRGLGVDFTKATEEGLRAAYRHGLEKGEAFLVTGRYQ